MDFKNIKDIVKNILDITKRTNDKELEKELKKDKEIVLAAVKRNKDSLEYMTEQLKSEKELLLEEMNNKNQKTDDVNTIKKLFNGDYTAIKNNFKNDYYYSLRSVEEEFKSDVIVVTIALEKNITDLRYVAPDFIRNTSELQKIIGKIAEENPSKLEIIKKDIEVGAGTTLVFKGFLNEEVDSINALLLNKDYRQEFDNLFPDRTIKTHVNNPVDHNFLEGKSDIYLQLNNAVKAKLEKENSSKKNPSL